MSSAHKRENIKSSAVLTRDCLKCNQCRKDNKKCIGGGTPGIKCHRCQRLGHACSTLVRAGQEGRPLAEPETYPQETLNSASSSQGSSSIFSSNEEEHVTPTAFHQDMLQLTTLQRIVLRLHYDLAKVSQRLRSYDAYQRLHRICKSTHDMIRQCYNVLRTTHMTHSAGQRAICATGDSREIYGLQLLFALQSLQLRRFETERDLDLDLSELIPFDSPSWEPLHVRCTRSILVGIKSGVQSQSQPGYLFRQRDYSTVEKDIRGMAGRLLIPRSISNETSEITEDQEDSIAPALNIPASHLAYWSNNKDAAFALATENGVLDLRRNSFGQSLVNLAVIDSDVEFLERLLKRDRKAFTEASINGPLPTALDMAITLDKIDTFEILTRHTTSLAGCNIRPLRIAMLSNSADIVDAILEGGKITKPPYHRLVLQIMHRCQHKILSKFVKWFFPPFTRREDVQDLVTQAENRGLYKFSRELQSQETSVFTSQDAGDSLRQHEGFLSNDGPFLIHQYSSEVDFGFSQNSYPFECSQPMSPTTSHEPWQMSQHGIWSDDLTAMNSSDAAPIEELAESEASEEDNSDDF